jgi:hypothetical protein
MSSRKRGPKQAAAAVSREGVHSNGGAGTEASSGGGGGGGGGSGGGGGGSSESPPVAKRTRLAIATDHDPVPFECPCGSCEYDCQKRAPVRAACTCRRLLCRKCAGVTASLPDPGPCGLCGAASVGPFEEKVFVMDRGVLLALAGRLAPGQPYVSNQVACGLCVCLCLLLAPGLRRTSRCGRGWCVTVCALQAAPVCGLRWVRREHPCGVHVL